MAKKVYVPPGQAVDWFLIAPSNSQDIVNDATNNPIGYEITSGLYVGDTGTVTLALVSPGGKVLPLTVVGPKELPYSVRRINVTGTTAVTIYGLISSANV